MEVMLKLKNLRLSWIIHGAISNLKLAPWIENLIHAVITSLNFSVKRAQSPYENLFYSLNKWKAIKSNRQLKYSNYVAFSHDHGFAVNNSGITIKQKELLWK